MLRTRASGRSLIIIPTLALVVAAGFMAARPSSAHAVVSEAGAGNPPEAVLRTKGPGRQFGSMSSGSIGTTFPDGSVVMMIWETLDSEPRRLSAVRPGEPIVLLFRRAATMNGTGAVYRNGCEGKAPRRTFAVRSPRVVWRVPRRFRPGMRFELNVGGEFTLARSDGATTRGQTSWSFGLLVAKNRTRAFVRNRGSLACHEH